VGGDTPPQRVSYLFGHYFPPGGINESRHCSLTAISHWLYGGHRIGEDAFNSANDSPGYLESAEVSFETLWGNDNLQVSLHFSKVGKDNLY
jgi:hypothetical protein